MVTLVMLKFVDIMNTLHHWYTTRSTHAARLCPRACNPLRL